MMEKIQEPDVFDYRAALITVNRTIPEPEERRLEAQMIIIQFLRELGYQEVAEPYERCLS